jgi:hypothetical protein
MKKQSWNEKGRAGSTASDIEDGGRMQKEKPPFQAIPNCGRRQRNHGMNPTAAARPPVGAAFVIGLLTGSGLFHRNESVTLRKWLERQPPM